MFESGVRWLGRVVPDFMMDNHQISSIFKHDSSDTCLQSHAFPIRAYPAPIPVPIPSNSWIELFKIVTANDECHGTSKNEVWFKTVLGRHLNETKGQKFLQSQHVTATFCPKARTWRDANLSHSMLPARAKVCRALRVGASSQALLT